MSRRLRRHTGGNPLFLANVLDQLVDHLGRLVELALPGEDGPLNEAEAIRERLEHELAAVLDAGACPLAPTTVLDLAPMDQGQEPILVRQGRGELTRLGL